jgi:hypothetical protein
MPDTEAILTGQEISEEALMAEQQAGKDKAEAA